MSKRIKEEFGLENEELAVKEYICLNQDFMSATYPLLADEVIARLNLRQGFILDLGTGLGSLAREFAKRLAKAKVFGIDISEEMLTKAKEFAKNENLANIEFILQDAGKLNFPENYFDLVVSYGVLHHLKDLKGMFSQLKRVLKKEGYAFLYDLRPDSPKEVIFEIAQKLPSLQSKAFLESVKESLSPDYFDSILKELGFSEYAFSTPHFSRATIVKNKAVLEKSKMLGRRFNEIILEISLKN